MGSMLEAGGAAADPGLLAGDGAPRGGARRVGAVYRGGVVAFATARLIFACWIRRSAVRRTVPHTYGESRLAQNIHGDHSCRGVRPGTPPACEGRGCCPGAGEGGQLIISAHTTPASLPRAVILAYLACSRCWAFQDRASVSGGRPACRCLSVAPIAGRYR